MDRKFLLPIAVLAVAILVAVLIFAFPPAKGLVVEGMLIDTGSQEPFTFFSRLSEQETFLVSPMRNEETKPVDHTMFNGSAMFLQVVVGNGRKAVQVVRVYGQDNSLSYCLTNYGDVNRSERMDADACMQYLVPENGAVILLDLPNDKLQSPVISLGNGAISIKPKSEADIGKASFLALRLMFKNSGEIIERANNILAEVQRT